MPWPNLNMACANGEMNATGAQCYTSQLYFRKKLNELHRDLYGPGKENGKFFLIVRLCCMQC